MMFCPKCGSILLPRKDERKIIMACNNCRYISSKKENLVLKEKTEFSKEKNLEVIDKKADVLPKTKETCPKCEHREAYYWGVQTRAADEAETRFFKCVKCQHTWRQY